MRMASWANCIESGLVTTVSPDRQRAKSLIETANERINLTDRVNERNCNFVFEDYYTSLLEIMHAKAILGGYKIKNHICLGYFLRDVLKKDELYVMFDDVRYKRNALTYYGNRMEFEVAEQAIEKCKKLISSLKSLASDA